MHRRTNRRAVIHAITICLAATAGVGDQAFAGTRSATQSEILALQKRFADAYVAADRVALDQLLDDRAVFVHGDGRSLTKAQLLSSMDKSPGAPQQGARLTKIRLAEGYRVFLFGSHTPHARAACARV